MKRLIIYFLGCLVVVSSITLAMADPGDIIWTRRYGGNYDERAFCVQQTTDGGFIIAGFTESNVTFSWIDYYLIKTDSNGGILWITSYSLGFASQAQFVQQTSDSGFVCAGFTWDQDTYDSNMFLIKTDSSGDTLWTRIYQDDIYQRASCVRQTDDGGYILSGEGFLLCKADSAGNILWSQTQGGGSQETYFTTTSDGGYIMTGTSWDLVKTNSLGDTLWTRSYDGEDLFSGSCVRQTADGGYIITGDKDHFEWDMLVDSDIWLIKTDQSGDSLWTRRFGKWNLDHGSCVQQTADSGYIVTGSTQGTNPYTNNIYLIRTDTYGDTLWTRVYGGERATAVLQDDDGNYIVLGYIEGTNPFGQDHDDIYLMKIEGKPTKVDDINPLSSPERYILKGTYPNPFNSQTTISYSVPTDDHVTIRVFNLCGQYIETLVDGPRQAGVYSISWDASGYASGVYFCRLDAGNCSEVKKMVLLK